MFNSGSKPLRLSEFDGDSAEILRLEMDEAASQRLKSMGIFEGQSIKLCKAGNALILIAAGGRVAIGPEDGGVNGGQDPPIGDILEGFWFGPNAIHGSNPNDDHSIHLLPGYLDNTDTSRELLVADASATMNFYNWMLKNNDGTEPTYAHFKRVSPDVLVTLDESAPPQAGECGVWDSTGIDAKLGSGTCGSGGGYATIENAGNPLAQETVLDFTGDGVTCTPGTGETTCDIPGAAANAAGSIKEVQYNGNGTAFGAEAGFEYDAATDTLSVGTLSAATTVDVASGASPQCFNLKESNGAGGSKYSFCATDGATGDIEITGAIGADGKVAAAWMGNGSVGVATLSAAGSPGPTTYLRGDNTWATPGGGGDVVRIASDTIALTTTPIGANDCATADTDTATGAAATDVISWTPNGDIEGVNGYGVGATGDGLVIYAWPTTNTVNFKVCNATDSSITPGAVTLNWRIDR